MTAWQAFLQNINATELDGGDSAFADDPTALAQFDGRDTLMPLSPYGLLMIEGPDAEKFLQGQLTCHVAETDASRSTPGAYCTPKGRMVCSFQLARPSADRFLLRMRGDLLDHAAATLQKYIVFSKAEQQRRDDLLVLGLNGPNAAALINAFAGSAPAGQHATLAHGDALFVQCDADGTRFECWASAATAQAFWEHCRPHCTATGSRYWRWLNIRAGAGEVCAATVDAFIPQMLNYHVTGAVNFKKGCYTGQEIVARAYYRGQVKRHLIRAELDSAAAPLPGAAIEDENRRSAGSVVDAVATDIGHVELLAVISADPGDDPGTQLQIEGAPLGLLPLPYAIP